MLIPFPAFQKTCIVIFSRHFCHELCMEHSTKNVFIKGFQLCSLRFQNFRNTCIVICSAHFPHEVCMEDSFTQVFIVVSARLPEVFCGYTLIETLHLTQLISSLDRTLSYKHSTRFCVFLSWTSATVEYDTLSCRDFTNISYYCL